MADRMKEGLFAGRWGGGSRDRGSATVWTIAGALIPVVVAATALAVAAAVAARHRAGAAADLAALAAADRVPLGPAVACAAAADVAQEHGATVMSCVVRGVFAEVVTEVRAPPAFAAWGPARAEARAGPVGGDPARGNPSDGRSEAVPPPASSAPPP